MREDKLIRPANASSDGALLATFKRACMRNDEQRQAEIVSHLSEMSRIALADGDKSLRAHCKSLADQLKSVLLNPGNAVVLETKSLALKRAPLFDHDESTRIDQSTALGTIAGYGAAFNNVDFGGDVIAPGAFAASLARWKREGRLPIMLAQHDAGIFPIGRWDTMVEDDYGLRVSGTVANTARGREAWTLINMSAPALDGMSIGYSTVRSKPNSSGGRLLQELELFELSIVGLPMNTLARIDRRKCAHDPMSKAIADCLRALNKSAAKASAMEDGTVINFPRKEENEATDAMRKLAERIELSAVAARITNNPRV